MIKECVCGCGALPIPATELLTSRLVAQGFEVVELATCLHPTTVIAVGHDLTENKTVDKVALVKGVMFNYEIVDSLGGSYTIHCEVQL